MDSSQPASHLSEALTKRWTAYYILFRRSANELQMLDPNTALDMHERFQLDWMMDPTNPNTPPPVGDTEKRDAFFAKCDELCQVKPKTIQDHFRVLTVSRIASQVLRDQEIIPIPNGLESLQRMSQRAEQEYLRTLSKDEKRRLMLDEDEDDEQNQDEEEYQDEDEGQDEDHLIGQKIWYFDEASDNIREFAIVDLGTSHLRGDWYEISYEGTPGTQKITANEMEKIMENRV